MKMNKKIRCGVVFVPTRDTRVTSKNLLETQRRSGLKQHCNCETSSMIYYSNPAMSYISSGYAKKKGYTGYE